jgi:hypothetical protein
MSDLGWRADGIARAEAAGGITLETYRRPGYTGGTAVRRSFEGAGGSGFPIDTDPWPDEYDDDEDRARRR